MLTSDVVLASAADLVLIEVVSARLSREMQVEGDPIVLAGALERIISSSYRRRGRQAATS